MTLIMPSIVVKGYMRVVTRPKRIILRPAAIGILGGDHIIEAAIKGYCVDIWIVPNRQWIFARKLTWVSVALLSMFDR